MFWNKKELTTKEESSGCVYDECYECHHLIAKGSGQTVIMRDVWTISYGTSPSPRVYEYPVIFCVLCNKPYDRFDSLEYADSFNRSPIFEKRIDPWKRVNEDGSDYKEVKK